MQSWSLKTPFEFVKWDSWRTSSKFVFVMHMRTNSWVTMPVCLHGMC